MSLTESLAGKILVAPPKHLEGHFSKSIVLIAQHNMGGAWGVVVNRQAKTVNMQNIMNAAGIEYNGNEKIYVGGPVEPTRVQVVHSLDWHSSSTLRITDSIGITGDLSVLAAISANEGPKLYRAGVGLSVWSAGQLDGEMSGKEPWRKEHQWLTTNATLELCLSGAGEEQWQRAIDDCINHRIADFF